MKFKSTEPKFEPYEKSEESVRESNGRNPYFGNLYNFPSEVQSVHIKTQIKDLH